MLEKLANWRHQSHLRREAVLVFIISLLLFTVGTSHQEFINFDTRFALFAQEMLHNGLSFFPTAFGHSYPDYPATSTILIVLCSLPFGTVTKLTAVFPSAVAASLTLAFIYLTAAPLSRRWGAAGVLFALLTFSFVATARSIALDQYTTLVTTLCFYLVFSADLFHKPTPWWALPLLFLFGLACRGPIGLVIPASVTGLYFFSQKQWSKFFITTLIGTITLTFGTAILLLGAYLQDGTDFMHQVLGMQFLSRLHDRSADPFYYYFTNAFSLYAITFPIATCVLMGYGRKLCRAELDLPLKLLQQLLLWTLIIMVGLSIPNDKKARYILSIVPAISLIAAYLFVDLQQATPLRWLRKGLAWFCFIFPLVGAILTQVAKTELEHRGLHLTINFTAVIIVLGGLQAGAVLLCLFYRSGRAREIIALGVAVIVFIAVTIVVVEPIQLHLSQSRHFVTRVEILREAQPGKLVFYRANQGALLMRYVVNKPQYQRPIVDIQTVAALQALTPPVYVIMQRDAYERLPKAILRTFRIVIEGQVGHDAAVALEKIR